jgi:hypothetical protein
MNIGKGGYGTVSKVYDIETKEFFAEKIFTNEFYESYI